MNLNHLSYFRVLARLEHYTHAADELSITQPSLSHAMASLEKDLGTCLFEKQGRNVKLTKFGKIYFEYVDKALNELEKGEKKLRELINTSTGTIELGYVYTLGSNFAPKLIKEFSAEKEESSNIKFLFEQGRTKSLIEGLKGEKLDIIFCPMVEGEEDIDFIRITNEEFVVIMSEENSMSQREAIDLKEIGDSPIVGFSENSGIKQLILDLFKEAGITPNIVYEVEEDNAVAELVEEGCGIAVIPRTSLLDHYKVKVIPIINQKHERDIYMASLKNRYMAPSAQLFKEYMTEYSKN